VGKLNIPEEITLADVIPIVKALPFPQRQVLKQLLNKSDEEWTRELDKWRYFNKIPLSPNSLGEYEVCLRGGEQREYCDCRQDGQSGTS